MSQAFAKLGDARGASVIEARLSGIQAIALARENMTRGTCAGAAVSSHEQARQAFDKGEFLACIGHCRLSLALSVGTKHTDYRLAVRLYDSINPFPAVPPIPAGKP